MRIWYRKRGRGRCLYNVEGFGFRVRFLRGWPLAMSCWVSGQPSPLLRPFSQKEYQR